MDMIYNNVLSIINVYITKNVNSGDRNIDLLIIPILSTTIISIITIILNIYNNITINIYLQQYKYIITNLSLGTKQLYNKEHPSYSKHIDFIPFYLPFKFTKQFKSLYIYAEINKCIENMIDATNIIITGSAITVTFDTMTNSTKSKWMQNAAIADNITPIYYSTNTKEYIYISPIAAVAYYDSIETLKEFINWIDNYKDKSHTPLPTNTSTNLTVSNYHNNQWSDYPLDKKTTFNNLFFEDKEKIINIINRFKTGNLYPRHCSVINKIGILLFGPPGTGKTSFVKALAIHLNRNIININITNITMSALRNIIKSYKNTNILVFDEFDLMLGVLDKSANNSESRDELEELKIMISNSSTSEERDKYVKFYRELKDENKDKLNMNSLLQVMDGLQGDTENMIIVANTNRPSHLNPALMRPGRFDLKICMNRCSHDMIKNIIGYYYGTLEHNGTITHNPNAEKFILQNSANIPNGVISPMEIQNLCMQHSNIQDTLQMLLCWNEYKQKLNQHMNSFECINTTAIINN